MTWHVATCDKCKKKVDSFNGATICRVCKIVLCNECNTTLTALNFYVATARENHDNCLDTVNLV